jgi:hypothetical protein
MGAAIYGDLDAPRDEQIARGLHYTERERTHQRQIVAAIDELRRLTGAPLSPSGTAQGAVSDALSDEREDESHPTAQE